MHTPGPWHIGGRTITRPTLTIFHKPFGLGDVAEVYEEANARLIAKAPEMQDVLRRVADFWAGGDVPAELDRDIRALLED